MYSTYEPFLGLGNVIQARRKEVLSFPAMEVVTAYKIGFRAWGFRPFAAWVCRALGLMKFMALAESPQQ